MILILSTLRLFGLLFLVACETDPLNSGKPESISAKEDPLPSWNGGKSKQAIIDFVTKTTKEYLE